MYVVVQHDVRDGIVLAQFTPVGKVESMQDGMYSLVKGGATPQVVQIINGLVISSPSIVWVLYNGNVVDKAFTIRCDEPQ